MLSLRPLRTAAFGVDSFVQRPNPRCTCGLQVSFSRAFITNAASKRLAERSTPSDEHATHGIGTRVRPAIRIRKPSRFSKNPTAFAPLVRVSHGNYASETSAQENVHRRRSGAAAGQHSTRTSKRAASLLASGHTNEKMSPTDKTKKPVLTHFLCLPLINESSKLQLEASLEQFRAHACDPESKSPIPEKAIRPLGTLHLTIGVMSLPEPERLDQALAFLQDLDIASILSSLDTTSISTERANSRPEPLTVASSNPSTPASVSNPPHSAIPESKPSIPTLTLSLTGLHPMHAPSSTSILYASPTSTSPCFPFLSFCSHLHALFTTAGFLLPDSRPLRLHATIVNTIYARGAAAQRDGTGENRKKGKQYKSRQSVKLDARDLVQEWEGYVWAEGVRVERVALCKMGAKKVFGSSGELGGEEYEEVGSLSLL